MKFAPQKYEETTFERAVSTGCDTVQLKYFGRWVQIHVGSGIAQVYDGRGIEITHFSVPNVDISCILIGDLFNPPRYTFFKIVVWDCWESSGIDTTSLSYRNRFALAKTNHMQIGLPCVLAINYPIKDAQVLWENQSPEHRGIVYRCSHNPMTVPIQITRRYPNIPAALP